MNFADFHSQVQFFLQNSTKDNSMWTVLILDINQRLHTDDLESVLTVGPLLLDVLWTGLCEDRDTVLKMVVIYARYLHVVDMHTLPFIINLYREISEQNAVDLRKRFARYILAPATFKHLGTWDSSEDDCGVSGPSVDLSAWLALNNCDWKFFNILVRHGFWNGSIEREMDIKDYLDFWNVAQTQSRHPELHGLSPTNLQGLAFHVLASLEASGGRTSKHSQRGFRRIFFIIRALKAVLELQPHRRDAYLRCLRSYFAVLPDPLVSEDEVKHFLQHMFRSEFDRPVVEQLLHEFRSIFGPQQYTARSLAHNCRVLVRKTLMKNQSATLPKLVKVLHIPRTLKEFLLGAPEASSW